MMQLFEKIKYPTPSAMDCLGELSLKNSLIYYPLALTRYFI
jgi:hypothetical protein